MVPQSQRTKSKPLSKANKAIQNVALPSVFGLISNTSNFLSHVLVIPTFLKFFPHAIIISCFFCLCSLLRQKNPSSSGYIHFPLTYPPRHLQDHLFRDWTSTLDQVPFCALKELFVSTYTSNSAFIMQIHKQSLFYPSIVADFELYPVAYPCLYL